MACKEIVIDGVSKSLMDQGKIIEAGWKGLEIGWLPTNASELQRNEMKKAFFAGAQHLFSCIMNALEDGQDATENDLRRMSLIADELNAFGAELTNDLT